MKNLNSFRYLQKAIEYEIERQIDVLESGGRVVQETRFWDSRPGERVSMRSKEEAHDYRYFPEPDLPPLVVDEARIARCARRCPSCRTRGGIASSPHYGLARYDAGVLTQSAALAEYFEEAAAASGQSEGGQQLGDGRTAAYDEGARGHDRAGAVAAGRAGRADRSRREGHDQQLDREGRVPKMYETGRSAEDIVASEGLAQTATRARCSQSSEMSSHGMPMRRPVPGGKSQTFGFLVGQVMKGSGGKANPKLANELPQTRTAADMTTATGFRGSVEPNPVSVPRSLHTSRRRS